LSRDTVRVIVHHEPALRPAANDIWTFLDGVPVVDTHEHLRPPSSLGLPMTPGRLLRRSYLTRNLRVSDGSPNGVGSNLEVALDGASWADVAPSIARVRFSSYYRWLMLGLADLYDLEEAELTKQTWDVLSDELPRRYGDSGWLTDGLDRANIEAVIWDPFWNTGQWQTEDPRLLPSFRIDSCLVAFHPTASDHDTNNVVRDWGPHFGIDVTRLADVEDLIERLLIENIGAGGRSLKFAWAYDRTLSVRAPDRESAERAMGRAPGAIEPALQLAFGDYIVQHVLDRARDLGLVVQVHTGMGRLPGSSPLLLDPLLSSHPDVVFDLFHGGYPWTRESAALAHQHPNVRLNMTWLPQLSSEMTAQVIKEWIQVVPQTSRISWGGDCQTIEETYGSLLAARYAVSRAIGELVEERYITLDAGILLARDLICDGGRAIYGVH
jgi:hypothetical protein